jgi:recombination protein RecT
MSKLQVIKKSELVEQIKTNFLNSSAMNFLGENKRKANEIIAGFLYTVNKNREILNCTQISILISLNQCAQYGLVAGAKQECALIPYGKELTFQPMVNGIIKTAYDSGFVTHIDCEIVHENDFFEYTQGTKTELTFKKNIFADRGRIHGGYCVVTLKDSQKIIEVMALAEIEKIQIRAKNKTIWGNHWSEMARKTVIKRALKRVVKSQEFAELIELDNKLERPDYFEQTREKLDEINQKLNEVEPTEVIETAQEAI